MRRPVDVDLRVPEYDDIIPGSAEDAMYMVGVVETLAGYGGIARSDRAPDARPDAR